MGKINGLLTKAQVDLAVLMLEGLSVSAAAKKIGASKSAAYRWTKLPAFVKRLEDGRRTMFAEAIGNLKAASGKAVEKLVNVMGSDDEGEARRAATTILEFGFRAKEIEEFEARIAALEARGPGGWPGGGPVYQISERFLPDMERQSTDGLGTAAGSVGKPDAQASK